MILNLTTEQISKYAINQLSPLQLIVQINSIIKDCASPEQAWQLLSRFLSESDYPFPLHLFLFTQLFPNWHEHPDTAPAWIPSSTQRVHSNIASFMRELKIDSVSALHQWSCTSYQDFWKHIIQKLNIVFKKEATQICDLSKGVESPNWLPNAEINIIDSCLTAKVDQTALIYEDDQKNICHMSYQELHHLSNRVANSLTKLGCSKGEVIGMVMPMNKYAIAIYLGIIKMGGIVVSIADSFSSQEIAIRLKIAKTKIVLTQDFLVWGKKQFPLYEKVKAAHEGKIIVLPFLENSPSVKDNQPTTSWNNFLVGNIDFTSVSCHPMDACHILFSSGTTSQPKAIPWNHTTPIKSACDAYFHHDIQTNDILCWPTNLGWMMGPWLVFAAFINHATIALYPDVPKDQQFGKFVEKAKVSMLGVVPTLVATWRQSECMQGLNWQRIKLFSSTGECSNPEDMLYLMSLAGYKPIIEYCGGTEIGGGYVSSTVIEKNYPSLFSTPTMGLNFVIIDEAGNTSRMGEVALIPPSIGLSVALQNGNHHQVYFENMPPGPQNTILRRHGDQIMRLENNYFIMLGRSDDTMNLGGIKISAVEIERALAGIPNIIEVAAVAITPPNHGPSQLIIYATSHKKLEKENTKHLMQKLIHMHLNPLFKIHDLIFLDELPKTASNKIMRRLLRDRYG